MRKCLSIFLEQNAFIDSETNIKKFYIFFTHNLYNNAQTV